MNATQTDTLIYKILKQSERLDISGDIYTAGERPDDSTAEDIVINNINFEHSVPQRGISNVNIHVQDLDVTIDGTPQKKANRQRLQQIATAVESIIESTIVDGVKIVLDSSQVFGENNEHYFNLRYSWIIAKKHITDFDIGDDTGGDADPEVIDQIKQEIENLKAADKKQDEKIKEATTAAETAKADAEKAATAAANAETQASAAATTAEDAKKTAEEIADTANKAAEDAAAAKSTAEDASATAEEAVSAAAQSAGQAVTAAEEATAASERATEAAEHAATASEAAATAAAQAAAAESVAIRAESLAQQATTDAAAAESKAKNALAAAVTNAANIATNTADIAENAKTIGILSKEIEATAAEIAAIWQDQDEQDQVLAVHARIISEATANIKTNADAITTLNGSEETAGSVKNIVVDYISKTQHLRQQVVDVLPEPSAAESNVMYLTPFPDKPGVYKQFAFINGQFVALDNTEVDLSNYYTKSETDAKTKANADAIAAQGKKIADLETASQGHAGKISALETASESHGGDIATLKTTTAGHTAKISELESGKVDKASRVYLSLDEYEAMTAHDANTDYFIYEEG